MAIRNPKPFESSSAFAHYQQLTMPPGALERAFIPVLRALAQRTNAQAPWSLNFCSALFAGDHGVAAAHPVSAFPQQVTGQMVANFAHGGAAMSVLSRRRHAPLYVVDVGVAYPYELPANHKMPSGITFWNKNLCQGAIAGESYPTGARDLSATTALSEEAFVRAFAIGREVVTDAMKTSRPDFLMLGEMGIGNTTPATAIVCQCLDISPAQFVGAGTGINSSQKATKVEIITKALERHRKEFGAQANKPEIVLRSLGGFELAAIAGAATAAAENGIHILMDGTIATAALLPFALASSEFKAWLTAGHAGAEPAHRAALEALGLKALLTLDLRLGEGSGAALAAGILQDALALLNEMATFASAGVDDKS